MPEQIRPATDEKWISLATRCGADNAAIADVASFTFREEFRQACEQNTCGCYNNSWMCPPHVGDIHALIAQARRYARGVVYQTIGSLEDSFDYEGMVAAKNRHSAISAHIQERLLGREDVLHLSAGACKLCERCAVLDHAPCRHPERALPSLEAYGVAVSELAAACGLKYINGVNTITYFGVVLFRPEAEKCPG